MKRGLEIWAQANRSSSGRQWFHPVRGEIFMDYSAKPVSPFAGAEQDLKSKLLLGFRSCERSGGQIGRGAINISLLAE
jgi:hypothetical protein